MYLILLKRSIEFQQFVRATVEKFPAIYQEIEKDFKFKANDMIAAVQDQVFLKVIKGEKNFGKFFLSID